MQLQQRMVFLPISSNSPLPSEHKIIHCTLEYLYQQTVGTRIELTTLRVPHTRKSTLNPHLNQSVHHENMNFRTDARHKSQSAQHHFRDWYQVFVLWWLGKYAWKYTILNIIILTIVWMIDWDSHEQASMLAPNTLDATQGFNSMKWHSAHPRERDSKPIEP